MHINTKKLSSHHILRRNRIIDNLIHQFSMEDAKLPIETPNFKQFCKYMQSCAEFMKNCDYQGELWSNLNTMGSYVDHIRKDMIGKTDIVFMKQKFPKEYELARRCKNLLHSVRNLMVSIDRYPDEMPGKYFKDLPKKGRPEKLKVFEIKGMHETIDHGHCCCGDYFSGKDLREAINRFFDKFPLADEILLAKESKGPRP